MQARWGRFFGAGPTGALAFGRRLEIGVVIRGVHRDLRFAHRQFS